MTGKNDEALRLTVGKVAALNLGYFGIEFAVALAIGSVALFADSVDFLEDASVNMLIYFGLGWSARSRAKLGTLLAFVLLVPAVATLWTAWGNFSTAHVPAAVPLTLAGLGALAVNFTCATMLTRFREHGGSLTRAAFLSARNDVLANIAIIVAGGITAVTASHWPDLIAGAGIAAMNVDAAHEVYEAARQEHAAAKA
jgi:Co/Zn/Cd efflux system component